MKSYFKEQPEKNKPLTFTLTECNETYEGTFDGINFRTADKAFSVLRYTVEWEYTGE